MKGFAASRLRRNALRLRAFGTPPASAHHCMAFARTLRPFSVHWTLKPPGSSPRKVYQKQNGALAGAPVSVGGDEGVRTLGLSVANAALSQLSYIPKRQR